MQLRRGPPPVDFVDDRAPLVRVLREAPTGSVVKLPLWNRLRSLDSYFLRIVAAALVGSIPIAVVLGIVMATWGVQNSTNDAKARTLATASGAATRITDWVAERKAELRTVALDYAGQLDASTLSADLLGSAAAH